MRVKCKLTVLTVILCVSLVEVVVGSVGQPRLKIDLGFSY